MGGRWEGRRASTKLNCCLLWACCAPADHSMPCSPAAHLLTTACSAPLLRAAPAARCGTAALPARMPTGGRGTSVCARRWGRRGGRPRRRRRRQRLMRGSRVAEQKGAGWSCSSCMHVSACAVVVHCICFGAQHCKTELPGAGAGSRGSREAGWDGRQLTPRLCEGAVV